jgi:hypothetical protein
MQQDVAVKLEPASSRGIREIHAKGHAVIWPRARPIGNFDWGHSSLSLFAHQGGLPSDALPPPARARPPLSVLTGQRHLPGMRVARGS